MLRPVVVSAPGKVLLHGEHAVVYDKVALVTSLDLRCYLVLLPTEDGVVHLTLPDVHLCRTWRTSDLAESLLHEDEKEGSQLETLRQMCGIASDTEPYPSTQSLAMLAFFFLLTNICNLRELSGLDVTVVSTLPAGAGLGSSAAYSVCLAAGLLSATGTITCNSSCDTRGGSMDSQTTGDLAASSEGRGRDSDSSVEAIPEVVLKKLTDCGYQKRVDSCVSWSQEQLEMINMWGFKAERLIHGTPSGIDNSISTFGGAITFQSGKIIPFTSMPQIEILLVNTKVPRSTKKMVDGVREKHVRIPSVIGPILDSIESIVTISQKHLEELSKENSLHNTREIYSRLQELIALNQHLLNAIGVGHPALDKVCSIASEYGLAAKLTGAGGGGCGLVLVPPDFSELRMRELRSSLTAAGFDSWKATVGSRGVAQHCIYELS